MKLSTGKKRLLDFLGKPYTTKVIDLENCVYRKIGDKFDIEISGGKTIRSCFSVFVWNLKDRLETIETHINIKPDLKNIKDLLDDIVKRYSAM